MEGREKKLQWDVNPSRDRFEELEGVVEGVEERSGYDKKAAVR